VSLLEKVMAQESFEMKAFLLETKSDARLMEMVLVKSSQDAV